MDNFLNPIFEFMEGNFIILNLIILYGIPTVVWMIGIALLHSRSKSVTAVGIILILIAIVSCVVLTVYAFTYGIIFTAICGLIWAGSMGYYSIFNDELEDKE
jgi:hypothetical protein